MSSECPDCFKSFGDKVSLQDFQMDPNEAESAGEGESDQPPSSEEVTPLADVQQELPPDDLQSLATNSNKTGGGSTGSSLKDMSSESTLEAGSKKHAPEAFKGVVIASGDELIEGGDAEKKLEGLSMTSSKASAGGDLPLGSAEKVQLQSMLDAIMGEAEILALHPSKSLFTFSELGLRPKKASLPKAESYQQLRTLYEHEESEFASKMPSIMELYAAGIETGLTLNDFAWPRFALDEPDQVYENLLAMTIINPDLCVMQGERVIMRKDHHETMVDKVKIITGGYAGNEPLFSGYVGKGMATAAVIGDRKNTPKSLAIYKTIKELVLHHNAGVIMIIPNVSDCRIVFGLAMERARSEGILVEMIVVSDDCCDHVDTKSGRRCLAGFVFSLKVAGAMAEDGRTMKEIFLMVRSILMVSISAHVNDGSVSMGTGIKDGGFEIKCVCNENEQDCEKQPTVGCATKTHNKLRNIVEIMLEFATGYKRYFSLPLKPFSEVVVMINSYTEDKMFLHSIVAEVLRQMYCQDVVVNRLYAGTFVSSRRGFSISLLKVVDETVYNWLDYPTDISIWPPSRVPSTIPMVTKSIYEMAVFEKKRAFGPKFNYIQQTLLPFVITAVVEDLIVTEATLNELDPAKSFGTCLAKGFKGLAAANKNQQLDYSRPYNFLHQTAMVLEASSTGIVASFLALFFGAMANEFLKFSEGMEVEYKMFGAALVHASEIIQTYAKIKPESEAYIGDVCRPAGIYLIEVAPELSIEDVLEALFIDAKYNISKSRTKPFGWHLKEREECACVAFLFGLKALIRARQKVAV